MKKFLIFAVLVTVLCFSTASYGMGAAGKGFHYIGLGGSYAFEAFDDDDLEDCIYPVDADFDDAWGVNLKYGYHFTDYFSLEGNFDYLANFETDESETVGPWVLDVEGELDIWTLMVSGKVSKPGNVSPFLVVGAGLMNAKLDAKLSVSGLGFLSDDDSDTQVCAKIGAGVDYFPTNNVSVGIEWSYVFGLSDFEFDMDEFSSEDGEIKIRYSAITLGVVYHF